MRHLHLVALPPTAVFLALSLWLAVLAIASQEGWTNEETEHFLRTAEIIDSNPISEGSTDPWRLTLSDGSVTHDAAFQYINERQPIFITDTGYREVHFRDSYAFNIAAYEIAVLIGLDDMVPVTVERSWDAKTGALSWWIDAEWDENERQELGLEPPDLEAWSRQIYRVRVFQNFIYDTDRNRGNMLITKDWKIWIIDFTRAFRRWSELPTKKGLVQCDRELFDNLERLDADTVRDRLDEYLLDPEIEGLLARRDLLVEHYRKLAEERGEDQVFY